MRRERLSTSAPYEPIVGYSRAVRVGAFIAVAGTTALDGQGLLVGEGDAAAQARQCLANLEDALARRCSAPSVRRRRWCRWRRWSTRA